MSWDAVLDQAKQFDVTIAQKWPAYHEEMEGQYLCRFGHLEGKH